MEKEKFQRHIKIVGKVTQDGGAGINILTEKDSYMVELDYVGKELLDYLNMNVKATGFVTKYNGGITQIEIDDYELSDEIDYVAD